MIAKSMPYTFLHRTSKLQFRKRTTRNLRNIYRRHISVCSNKDSNNDFTSFIKKIELDKIKDVYIDPQSNTLTYGEVNDDNKIIYDKTNVLMTEKLMEEMIDHNVKIHVDSNSIDGSSTFLSMLIPLVFFSLMYFVLSRISLNNGSNPMMGNNNNFEFKTDIETDVKFEDE